MKTLFVLLAAFAIFGACQNLRASCNLQSCVPYNTCLLVDTSRSDCSTGYLKHDTTIIDAAINIAPISDTNCLMHPPFINDSCHNCQYQRPYIYNDSDTCTNCCCFLMTIQNFRYFGTIFAFRMIANDDSTDICHFCSVYGTVIGNNPTYGWIADTIDVCRACNPINNTYYPTYDPPIYDTTPCGVHYLARTFTGPICANWWGGGGGDMIHVGFCLGNRSSFKLNTCHHIKLVLYYYWCDCALGSNDTTYVKDTVSFPICCDSTYHYCASILHQGTISKEIGASFEGTNSALPPSGETLIYPNPATGTATVEFTAPGQGAAVMTLSTITGLQIKRDEIQCGKSGKYQFSVDTHALSAGTYICTVRQGESYYNRVFIVVK